MVTLWLLWLHSGCMDRVVQVSRGVLVLMEKGETTEIMDFLDHLDLRYVCQYIIYLVYAPIVFPVE